MGGDAVFGDLVHLLGADLQLDALVARADHGGVDRAVVVLLGRRDVVLEASRHHRPGGVDDAERLVAFRHALHDHPKAEDVGQLLEADRLALHLAPDRIGALAPAPHPRLDAPVGELADELLLDLRDQADMPLGERVQPLADDLVGLRIELAKRQAFELLAHLVHADAAGERRIDVDRLLGDAAPRFRRHMLDGAHVVQAVGELDQEHAHVLGDRQQQLAQVLRLLRLARDEVEPLELGEAFDQVADILAEQLVDLGAGGLGVLDGVVQQRGDDGGIVELVVGEDRGDFERMGKIRIAGGALLLAMGLHGVDIGAVEKVLVGIGVVFAHPLDEIVLPHHRLGGLRRRLGAGHQARRRPLAREPVAGLALRLHPRQICRRSRHANTLPRATTRDGRIQDIMAKAFFSKR